MKYQHVLNSIYSRLDRLGDLPVFSATVNRIQQVSASRESDAMALAMAVMKDANLSAKLLKLANSPGYNRGQGSIQVVSRAVVLLGFERICSLSVTLKLVESFNSNHPDVDIAGLLMQAFLNGALVRELAQHCGGRDIEQTYLCGLLHNLGETVVAYTQPDLYRKLQKLRQSGESWDKLQLRALGGHFSDIGQDLAKSWGFSKAVVMTMDPLTAEQLKGEALLNYRLVDFASRVLARLHGRSDARAPGFSQLLDEFTGQTGVPRETLERCISDAYRLVCGLTLEYGLPVRPMIPPLESADPDVAEFNRRTAFYLHSRAESHGVAPNNADVSAPSQPAAAQTRQLEYLQELGELLNGTAPTQEILRKVIEAVVESTGCDRAALCLLSQDGRRLGVRMLVGRDQGPLGDYFEQERGQGDNDFFFRMLGQGSTLLVADVDQGDWRRRLPAGFVATVAPQGFVLAPLQVGERVLGCLYADRVAGNGALDDNDFRGFSRFVLQARLALSQARNRKGS